jgi:predicted nuclease of predicted toxin-antitoxin system
VKILADVNVSRRVVEGLRQRGVNIVRIPELLDPRSPDDAIVELARSLNAVVLSHDQDFSALLALSGVRSPSLISLRVTNVEVLALVELLSTVIRETSPDLAAGAIVSIDDAGVRVHRLPV